MNVTPVTWYVGVWSTHVHASRASPGPANAPPDPRMDEAVRYIESRQQADGRWILDRAYDEALAVTTGEQAGQPSQWNTLRALRVLRWYSQ